MTKPIGQLGIEPRVSTFRAWRVASYTIDQFGRVESNHRLEFRKLYVYPLAYYQVSPAGIEPALFFVRSEGPYPLGDGDING